MTRPALIVLALLLAAPALAQSWSSATSTSSTVNRNDPRDIARR
jgi:hypothetical protein